MKLQYKHQKFQADAAKAVVDVFAGQPYLTPTYMMDRGIIKRNGVEFAEKLFDDISYTGWSNQPLVYELTDDEILKHIQKIQGENLIKPSDKLEGKYNLTIEMETGVGKTYTYIKTMYELNKHYGWTKFIIVVPSVAIREGVYKSFQTTEDHFAEEYGKKIRYFIYNSSQLTEIDHFASDSSINVMIINSQAFNARGKDARRIDMKLDEFRSRRPIDIIARTNPILIIDEPQSVEGKVTKEKLKKFNPLITLRYSATHKDIYNMVYRLDAMEAYNKQLVKKIAVKGITETGTTATEGFVYLESINLSQENPTATIQFEAKGKNGIKTITRTVSQGYDLYAHSGELEEYKNNYIITGIDGRDDSVSFLNGMKIFAGDVIGKINEQQFRRIQIRETILSHIERERQLFHKGIKVLSLFFIDEVAKYKQYDSSGQPYNGIYADMFEEEYEDIVRHLQLRLGEDDYVKYLDAISAKDTHAGYFSIDKKGHITNSKLNKEKTSDDKDAYDLIMRNKELLLDQDPHRSPVRFIFSHSALKEGWDNPNVFQICTLKQSDSDIKKRQEVGRGLRLCVNQQGERMDESILGGDVHNINVLTVIASESYGTFTKALQTEIAETMVHRPRMVTIELFKMKKVKDNMGEDFLITDDVAHAIIFDLISHQYIDKKGNLTNKYHEDKRNNAVAIAPEAANASDAVLRLLDSVYVELEFKDPRKANVEARFDEEKFSMTQFKELWKRINQKTVYVVDFDTDELIANAVDALNTKLHVSKIFFMVEHGSMKQISSKEELQAGESFRKEQTGVYDSSTKIAVNSSVKYDLIGKLVEATSLTRKTIVAILTRIRKDTFDQFKDNPEEFILKAGNLINEEKATAIIEHITYNILDEHYDKDIFTEPTIKGRLDQNAIKTQKNLYDHLVYDSTTEKQFAESLDTSEEVAVYVKLPNGFYISTPVGRYNPDWAIAFYEDHIKHIYFVAETKGSLSSMQLRTIEESKIHCAREHFKAISSDSVIYDVVDNYQTLLQKVMR